MTADVHGYMGADYVVANGDTHVNGPCGSARNELQLTGRLVHEPGAGRKRRPSTGLVEVETGPSATACDRGPSGLPSHLGVPRGRVPSPVSPASASQVIGAEPDDLRRRPTRLRSGR